MHGTYIAGVATQCTERTSWAIATQQGDVAVSLCSFVPTTASTSQTNMSNTSLVTTSPAHTQSVGCRGVRASYSIHNSRTVSNKVDSQLQRQWLVNAITPPLLRRKWTRQLSKMNTQPAMGSCVSGETVYDRCQMSEEMLPDRRRTLPPLSFSPLLAGKCSQVLVESNGRKRVTRSSKHSSNGISPTFVRRSSLRPAGAFVCTSTQQNPSAVPTLFDSPSPVTSETRQLHRNATKVSPALVTSTPVHSSSKKRKTDLEVTPTEHSLNESEIKVLLESMDNSNQTSEKQKRKMEKTPLRRCSRSDKPAAVKQLIKVSSFKSETGENERDSFWDDDVLLADPHFLAQIDSFRIPHSNGSTDKFSLTAATDLLTKDT